METQYISLNMTPTGVNPCFHISQYDVGRMLGFIVHSGGATVDLDTYTCTIEATRSDGTAITSAVATTDNIGTFEVTPTMSNKTDKYRCQLVIVDANSKRIASLPFDMDVCKAAMDENSESIEEDASLYQQYTEAVQGAIAEANADIQAEENARIAAVSAEATARQNADATLQNNIDAEATARQTADNTLQGNINSEAATRASADSNLQSQINQIISPSGEAPSAAEVQNARIGADGVTYNTLGDAIRTQVNNTYNFIDTERSSNDSVLSKGYFNYPYEKVNGKYINTNGNIYNDANYFITKPIPVYPKQLIECRSDVDLRSTAIYAITTRDGVIRSVGVGGGDASDFIIRYFNNSDDTIFVIFSSKTETNFYTKIVNVEYKTDKIINRTMFYKNDTSIVETGINPSTGLSNNYTLSTPIKLRRGQTIDMYARVSTSIPAIIKTDEFGNTYIPKVTGSNVTRYRYTAEDEVEYVMVQYKDDDTFVVVNIENKINNKFNMDTRKGTICFIFDDGATNDSIVVDMFRKRNLRCGFALLSTIATDGRANEYLAYQKDGFSILSHSIDADGMNDASIGTSTINKKMLQSLQHLMLRGFDIKGWVTPSSQLHSSYKDIPPKYYSYAYTNYYGAYTGQSTPPYNKLDEQYELYRVDCNSALEDMKDAVDLTIQNSGFLTFYYHAARMDATHKQRIEDLLDYIVTLLDSGAIRCLAPNDAFEYYFAKRTSDNIAKKEFTPTIGTAYSDYGNCYYEKEGKTVHVHIGMSDLNNGRNIIYQLPLDIRPTSGIISIGVGASMQTSNLSFGRILENGNIDVRPGGGYAILDFTYMI